jgi:CheY-like chemotaxis protein
MKHVRERAEDGWRRSPAECTMNARGGAPATAVVLIVEDEAPIAEVVSYVVEDAGYTPLVVANGLQALEAAQARWPALVITDLMMPRLNGVELIAALRAEAAADRHKPSLPVILLTAAGMTRAHAAGADAVLPKPFDLVDLEALLARFLPGARDAAPS